MVQLPLCTWQRLAVWFKKDKEKLDQDRLPTLEAAVSNFRRRLREVKRELEQVKSDQRKFERELLLKLGRLEGVLGIGLGSFTNESAPNQDLNKDIEWQRRRQEEEAERIALEQLGTGGSAQAVSDAITSKEEEG